MTSSDEYRRRAGECLLFTNYVRDERTKHLLVEMARSWHDLAERADQQELAGKRARRHLPKSGSGGSDKT